MLARRSPIRPRLVGPLALFLFICFVIVVRNVTALDQELPPVPTATLAGTPAQMDIPIGPAPLVLTKSASTTTVTPGQSFTYTLHVTANREQARVEVRDMPDPGVEIVSIDSSAGSCSIASTVVCTVQAGASKPAVITIVVRARNDVAPNTWLIGQALAQDDLNFTAASERVAVQVIAPPPIMSAPIPEMPVSPDSASAPVERTPDQPAAPEPPAHTRIEMRTMPFTVPQSPTAMPLLSRAAAALSGAVEPMPLSTATEMPGPAVTPESWLDLVIPRTP
ncbi:MAG: DUF11 domain-containing protein [Roseiflexus sp.]|jgi:hypothetical protein|nr:DUF11 domain-containing protein [Roseiflexus sp.]MBO9364578.1 DUF11 domain-containing protein [Roseiflexus sp.]MBO9383082.1 DUF11 domain-containing protein [Roseiflexus sp.]MBO9388289.1 DUF11 domain-containing protein [Roseiflexus sp.]